MCLLRPASCAFFDVVDIAISHFKKQGADPPFLSPSPSSTVDPEAKHYYDENACEMVQTQWKDSSKLRNKPNYMIHGPTIHEASDKKKRQRIGEAEPLTAEEYTGYKNDFFERLAEKKYVWVMIISMFLLFISANLDLKMKKDEVTSKETAEKEKEKE